MFTLCTFNGINVSGMVFYSVTAISAASEIKGFAVNLYLNSNKINYVFP